MPTVNRKLKDRMRQLGYGQAELARQVSTEIEVLTGAPGKVGDADVRRWLRGETKWPQDRIRLSLERVLSAPAEDLGFVPRKKKSARLEGAAVQHRGLLVSTGRSVRALGTPGSSEHGRLGVHDIRRFHRDYVTILRHDDAGWCGPTEVENLAVELASHIESALIAFTPTTRLRQKLFRLIAEVISTAAAASIDARAPRRARMHLDRALAFAGLSRDSEAAYHVWNYMFLAASQRENHAEAVAGAEVMKRSSIARRDPLYTSLGHMRNANGLARLRRPSEALRALKDAERAFARADDQERGEWMRFYDNSEFEALSSFVWAALRDHRRAEYNLHRSLASLPDDRTRNRALYTAHLALIQAKQDELELACATGRQVFELLPSPVGSRRTANTLAATRKVLVASGSKAAEVTGWIEESGQWI
ncbi:XRE family transcriptional regulator [Streptomyces sp. NPDC094031]|uniref:XRE family transcriptional regulator n=1 Tax=Streptomyces sp. NPDC094031 TaxID=3155307 RepID=UPI00331D7800